jgi:UDP-galactopyranose mutase
MDKYLVVGCGFSGSVMARELAEQLPCTVDVIDERNHIGGNCHTFRDDNSGVMIHAYGPHIFNTNDEKVWDYVRRHGSFRPFINRVKSSTKKGVFSMPINLHTINQFFGTTMNPREARRFIDQLGDKSIRDPKNFEEQALKMIGRDLYETFFYGYTLKQWGCQPRELPASVLKRLPIRFNYDDNYNEKKYCAIPEEGYDAVVGSIINHPAISVKTGVKINPETISQDYRHVFWTGPIDAYFSHSEGRLGYRTVTFERIDAEGDYQGNAQINYPDPQVPYTRIHEHKHFTPWETHEKTVAFREYSKETMASDIPYYPKRLKSDLDLLSTYCAKAELLRGVTFLGRLATYRYMDMEAVIRESLDLAQESIGLLSKNLPLPVFPHACRFPDTKGFH